MEVGKMALDWDSLRRQAQEIWWGPSLSAVISEIETFRQYPGYLLAIVQRTSNSRTVVELIGEHCEARARISLWDSISLAVSCLKKPLGAEGFVQQLEIVHRLVLQYFRWMPCSHAELQFHTAMHRLRILDPNNRCEVERGSQFLQYLVGRLAEHG